MAKIEGVVDADHAFDEEALGDAHVAHRQAGAEAAACAPRALRAPRRRRRTRRASAQNNEIREPRVLAAPAQPSSCSPSRHALRRQARARDEFKGGPPADPREGAQLLTQNCLPCARRGAAHGSYSGLTSVDPRGGEFLRQLYISVTVMAMCFRSSPSSTRRCSRSSARPSSCAVRTQVHPAVDGMMASTTRAQLQARPRLLPLLRWPLRLDHVGCAPPPATRRAACRRARRAAPTRQPTTGRVAPALRWLCSCRSTFCCTRCACTSASSADGRGGHRPLRGQRGARRLEGHDLNEQQCLSGRSAEQPQRRRRPVVGGSSSRDGSQRGTPTPTSSSSFPTGKRALGHALGIAGGGAAQ